MCREHILNRRTGWWWAKLVASPLLVLWLALSSAIGAEVSDEEAFARLIDSSSHPVPVVPIAVAQLDTGLQVQELLTTGSRPILFQISQAKGEYAAPLEVRLFEMVATEYALRVAFRKVVAGSEAAGRLYPRTITKPVYVLCNRTEKQRPTCAFVNEAEMSDGAFIKQTTIENFIYRRLAIAPSVLTTFSLTPTNVQSLVFDDQTAGGDAAPTAKWIVVLFFPGGEVPGSTNRLRVLLALERFFYGNRIRIAEADLSNAASVYSVLSSVRTVPNDPELWLFKPGTRQGSKYDSKLADLTHSRFEAWLARRGVTPPRDAAIDLQAAWRELARLETNKKK